MEQSNLVTKVNTALEAMEQLKQAMRALDEHVEGTPELIEAHRDISKCNEGMLNAILLSKVFSLVINTENQELIALTKEPRFTQLERHTSDTYQKLASK